MTDKFSLNNKVALVTGASSGIGAHAAQLFATEGAKVVLTARRADRLEQLAQTIRDKGGEAIAVAMDVQDPASVIAAFDQAEASFGVVDVLLNNAGYGGQPQLMNEATEDNWNQVIGINLSGAWRVAKEAGARLVKAGKTGSIINTTSVAAHGQAPGSSTYGASKAGLLSLTKAQALELAPQGIRVNAVSPGTFATEMTADEFDENGVNKFAHVIPMKRTGDLEDMDGVFLLLASEAGRYITGVAIPVDGGHLLNSL